MKNYTILLLFLTAFSFGARSFTVTISQLHGAGCGNQSGKLKAVVFGNPSAFTYLWSNGATTQIIDNLPAGEYSVTVYSPSDSAVDSYTLRPFGVGDINVWHACNGETGSIDLGSVEAAFPVHFDWYHDSVLMSPAYDSYGDLDPGTYHYVLLDSEGCIDSGTVEILTSSPQIELFIADPILCWQEATQIWFTPGFTVTDYWGNDYNTSTDTLLYTNVGWWTMPSVGIDSLGCMTENELSPMEQFDYLGFPEPPLPLYQLDDTLSVFPTIDLAPSSEFTYEWHHGWDPLGSTGGYAYLAIDTSGTYHVTRTDGYGCTRSGTIHAAFAGLAEAKNGSITVYPNPVTAGSSWQIAWNGAEQLPYTILDRSGKVIATGQMQGGITVVKAPETPGMYFLELDGASVKLVVTD